MRFDVPPPEPLASAPGFLLSWNGQRMAHVFAATLEPLGLRPPHFGVLTLIDSHPGCAQQELVDRSLIDPSSMVAVIDELEELGLAERRAHPGIAESTRFTSPPMGNGRSNRPANSRSRPRRRHSPRSRPTRWRPFVDCCESSPASRADRPPL